MTAYDVADVIRCRGERSTIANDVCDVIDRDFNHPFLSSSSFCDVACACFRSEQLNYSLHIIPRVFNSKLLSVHSTNL
jgi:hypothetical protein